MEGELSLIYTKSISCYNQTYTNVTTKQILTTTSIHSCWCFINFFRNAVLFIAFTARKMTNKELTEWQISLFNFYMWWMPRRCHIIFITRVIRIYFSFWHWCFQDTSCNRIIIKQILITRKLIRKEILIYHTIFYQINKWS